MIDVRLFWLICNQLCCCQIDMFVSKVMLVLGSLKIIVISDKLMTTGFSLLTLKIFDRVGSTSRCLNNFYL